MYTLKQDQKFEIENYQNLKPFSSFLPGIAGVNGIPMWAFYVSRGQGIASFGVQDKNHAIMEFLPADKSYQNVAVQGFRTFIKITQGDKTTYVEPFSQREKNLKYVTEKMSISENMLELEYENRELQLHMKVEYVILPDSPIAGLVRHVTVKNLSEEAKQIELLDGLPSVFPSGVPNAAYKELGNTIKSWFDVTNLDSNIPFYRLRGSIEDSSEVKEIQQGNFYLSYSSFRGEVTHLQPIIDRDIIFGSDTTLQVPDIFLEKSLFELLEEPQQTTNKISSGFSPVTIELDGGEEVELFTVIGHANRIETIHTYVTQITVTKLRSLMEKAKTITEDITKVVSTRTGQATFDAYTRQCYLDNGLRGGFPITFEKDGKNKLFYLFSRKHGDLERDYNFFSISPTYYSQGNGNYRDINQNRRCDIFFEPKVGDFNINMFMDFIQLDGYNPLVVKGVRFAVQERSILNLSHHLIEGEEKVRSFLNKSFTPGELKHFLEDRNIQLRTSFEEFLTDVLVQSEESFQGEFGEGYWMDHWTYNLDLVDSYLAIYPDKVEDLYFTPKYRYFESPVMVKGRKDKYFVKNGQIRQYHAIEKRKEKVAEAEKNDGVLWIRKNYGQGEIYRTNLYSKLFLLSLVKVSTVAPLGLGIEMEGDKPGWNDSLNGLPGMLGASTSELFELSRLIEQLLRVKKGGMVTIPVEAAEFLEEVTHVMSNVSYKNEASEWRYWNQVTALRERYREKIYKGITGEEKTYSLDEVRNFLLLFQERVNNGIEQVQNYGEELVPTYFYFEAKEEMKDGELNLEELQLAPKAVTPFLEGIVKQLKVTTDLSTAKELYERVKKSNIYDSKLNMYKTSMSIHDEPLELGRAKSFTPGWLENESVFLHMEYKYLLELLKVGLTEEFFSDIQKALIPFLDPKIYGRSTLENSSFIASSANPNPELHGRGFVSRLSGSTIEFLNMWVVMMAGKNPFIVRNGELTCQISPTLPGWMFDESGKVTFTFLGSTEVTYVNTSKVNTYGEGAVTPSTVELIYSNGKKKETDYSQLTGEIAEAIRSGEMKEMRIILA
ncbi:hypothetical protein [Evansella tamaricis]|uniref:Cellobiose phosphorylase n=1 Tax=Evansella tamaricis TaxID=2069301 RepID=A0ABS6JGW6_9BACI|nr:hypothetical protein [Evansella tamaricis]MBU9712888.1 hypothetical protein [Evansella tamaricis]